MSADQGAGASPGLFRSYFGTGAPATPAEVTGDLWNDGVTSADFTEEGAKYQAAVMEQYKIYVEMTDRISARRALANTFFLSLNAAILTVIGALWKGRPTAAVGLLAGLLVFLFGLCLAWFWLVRSYRQLNSGKFAVIGALEARLPASPYWSAEWTALGKGSDKSRYWPLTHLEQWVPCLFAAGYLFGFLVAVLS